MHELSIAESLLEIACQEAAQQGNARVEIVYLKLGALSGVVADALEFAWEVASRNTSVAGSRLSIEAVPVEVRCRSCRALSILAEPLDLVCPHCGAPVDVLRGTELELTGLDITDP